MPERGKKTQTFHINLLKEFHPRAESEAAQLCVRVVREEEEPTEQYFPTSCTQQAVDVSHLEQPQRDQVKQLLDPELFQEKPGHTDLVLHDVILREATPARQKSYRIPERLVMVLKDELDIILSMGVIEPAHSEWCSPIVLVPKKDGTLRFCIDFRQINSLSKVNPYPMPRIDELVERLGRAKYLSTVDLCKGYWQVPLTARAKELTAFKTPFGLYHFRIMPFGLQGAPATFQRLMDQILQGTWEFAAAYLDDVVIFSETCEDHCQHLRQVLGRIKAAGLTINPKKCTIAKREIIYLGFVIGGGVIRPQLDKVATIEGTVPLPLRNRWDVSLACWDGIADLYLTFLPGPLCLQISLELQFPTRWSGRSNVSELSRTYERQYVETLFCLARVARNRSSCRRMPQELDRGRCYCRMWMETADQWPSWAGNCSLEKHVIRRSAWP